MEDVGCHGKLSGVRKWWEERYWLILWDWGNRERLTLTSLRRDKLVEIVRRGTGDVDLNQFDLYPWVYEMNRDRTFTSLDIFVSSWIKVAAANKDVYSRPLLLMDEA